MAKYKAPILPKKRRDPTGSDALERRAIRDFNKRINKIKMGYKEALESVPKESLAANRSYTYELDQRTLQRIINHTEGIVDSMLLEGGLMNLWFFEQYVEVAAERGTSQQWANLTQQSPTYRAAVGTLGGLLASEPYRRRLALIAAREFEEMKGLVGNVKANMSRVLTDGMARGLNPREISKNITEQTGIEKRRAERIARTEINTALRRARLDESEDAQERYALRSLEMHYSALSPTTREEHKARHGKLYTVEQQRAWWATGANSINCKCSTISVLVDENENPLFPEVVERAKRAKRD